MDAPGRRSGTIAVPVVAVTGGPEMTGIALVGLDIAKSWFQVHATDSEGGPVPRRKLRRDQVAAFFAGLPPVSAGIGACSTSHHWARTIERLGHRVRLVPPRYVERFVKRSKTDSADAEAPLRRPRRRDQASRASQAALAVHRARDLLVRQRTMLTNAAPSFAAEFGIVSAKGDWPAPALRARPQGPDPRSCPRPQARCCGPSSGGSPISTGASSGSSARSWRGTAKARSAGVRRPSPASARSTRRRSPRLGPGQPVRVPGRREPA
jgi:hypothetical protein